MSKPQDRIRGIGPEADGIEEYDNDLPDWWVGLFILTVFWGVAYTIDWHFISMKSQEGLYEQELVDARLQWPDLDKKSGQDASPEALALGAEVFTTTCTSCHGADMHGGIGPNLVDDTWIHGGAFDNLATVITDGVAAKGMPAWGPILGPKKVAAVASYVLSKHEGGTAEATADAGGGTHLEAGGETVQGAAAGTEVPGEVDGEAVFQANCVVCHAADLTGGVGPNLVDDTWIHGGELAQIRDTIEKGVPAKGMITWKGVLSDAQIDAVAGFIFTKSHPQ